jgi:hypothetical protein
VGALICFERIANYGQHSFDILAYVAVPKPQHTVSISLEICVTFEIALELHGLTMLTAIDLDDQLCRVTS